MGDTCPKCGEEYIRTKEHPDLTMYIHEEDKGGGPLGTNVLEDVCRVRDDQ